MRWTINPIRLGTLTVPMEALPHVGQPCTHVHVVSVVFTDGTMFKSFEACQDPMPRQEAVRRARRMWGQLHILEPQRPEPDVMDVVRYTREVSLS
jgi:hypothetical protein